MSEFTWVKPGHSDDELPSVIPVGNVSTVPPVDEVLPVRPADQEPPLVIPVRRRSILGAIWHAIGSFVEWIFGAVTLTIGLSVLAAIPLVQFLTLGYLLEASGRIARTGRFANGFIGVRTAARAGGLVLGAWLVLLPLRLISSMAADAQLIDPDGPVAGGWRIALTLLTIVGALHIVAACSRGGRLRYFFWPFNFIWLARRLLRGGYYAQARDAVWDFVVSLRLPYYFWLGVRGFAGALVWLAVPISLLALGSHAGPLLGSVRMEIHDPRAAAFLGDFVSAFGFFIGLMGGILLALVLLYLPFLQVRFAAENRFRAYFELGAVRRHFRRAPWLFAFALLLTLLFALPLYLFKIEIVPREAAWLPGLVFLVFIFPARLLTGWAYGWAEYRTAPRHWFFRWTGRLSMLPVVLIYVLIVFFTQYAVWGGVWSLYEQHAFLLPVPFAGM